MFVDSTPVYEVELNCQMYLLFSAVLFFMKSADI